MRNCRNRQQLALQEHRHLLHSEHLTFIIHNSTFKRTMRAKQRTMLLCMGVVALSGLSHVPAHAIDVHLTAEQIQTALDQGKEAAQKRSPPDTFYVRFGATDELHSSGFLITKLGGLSVMATHMALRGLQPGRARCDASVGRPNHAGQHRHLRECRPTLRRIVIWSSIREEKPSSP